MTESLLSHSVSADIIEVIDVETAQQIAAMATSEVSELAQVVIALTLRAYRDGHACLSIDNITSWLPHNAEVPLWPREEQSWVAAISENSEVFGSAAGLESNPRPPFIFENNRVYISRVYQEEENIASYLKRNNGEHVSIILGGPGTGKTFTVAERLRAIPDSDIRSLALCAPTGKASRHLRAVLDKQLREKGASKALLTALQNAPSTTVHRLLGFSPHTFPKFTYGSHEPLPYELVIIDEVSMMSLSMMNKLMEAMAPSAELWLVGDPNQLASVEAGSVLADIATVATDKNSWLWPRSKELTDNHRFGNDSPIAQLSAAVNKGKAGDVINILTSGDTVIEWIDPVAQPTELKNLINTVTDHAKKVRDAAQEGDVAHALRLTGALQVLSAQREGTLGIYDWNAMVESSLGQDATKRWYAGRPIMITRNDASLNLANGDVGVVCNENGTLVAQFGDAEAPVAVSLARLADVDTVHALTIHKSQGSEYDHVIVVLPESGSRIITRELLYTGITRPKTRLTVVATEKVLREAVSTPVRRATGLSDRL